MRFLLLIVLLIYFAVADFEFKNSPKSVNLQMPDSLVSIIDFGANSSSPNNADAFKKAFDSVDNIYIPAAESAYLISGNLWIKKGKSITFEKGAVLDIAGTLFGNDTKIIAGNHQMFSLESEFGGTFIADTLFADWFGAKGDGLADDYGPLSKFFGLTDNFLFQYLKMGLNKNYYISNYIDRVVIKPFCLDGNGSTIIRNYKDITEKSNTVLNFSGKKIIGKALNQSIIAGSDILTLDNTIGVEEGMGLIIYSKELFGTEQMADNPDGLEKWHYHYKGCMSIVEKILPGGKIQLADKIPFAFDAKMIRFVDFYKIIPISVKNLNFSMVNVGDQISVRQLNFKFLFSLDVAGCRFVPNGYSAISAKGIYNARIKNIYIEAPKEGNSKILGVYGIVPSLNVNVVYDSIFARAMTHGIAFTGEPSYKVEVKNSNFKSVIPESNGFDSHASFEVRVYNSEIWGAQGNWGTFEFVNCKMHNTAEGNNVWQERRSGRDGKLNVTIRDSEIRLVNTKITSLLYMQNIGDSSNSYLISNCKIYLVENVPDSYTQVLNSPVVTDSTAPIKNVRIEGCSFRGNSRLFLPRKNEGKTAIKRGTFIFKNNYYSVINFLKPNDALFGEWIIDGNKPLSRESNFKIAIQNTDASYTLTNNELVGTAFVIKNNRGSFNFTNNKIYTGKQDAVPNVFSTNQNAIFIENSYPSEVKLEFK